MEIEVCLRHGPWRFSIGLNLHFVGKLASAKPHIRRYLGKLQLALYSGDFLMLLSQQTNQAPHFLFVILEHLVIAHDPAMTLILSLFISNLVKAREFCK
jgi:hypothetical protein